jgi:hypothetical protein
MNTLTLIVVPGPGARTVSVAADASVADLACQENLHGRDIIINGQGVSPANWATTQIPANAEVFATGSVKGNVSTATVIVVPGPGARTVSLDEGMTVADFVCRENLHGRDIIINGTGVSPTNWPNTQIPSGAEIFATGSVKGNASA